MINYVIMKRTVFILTALLFLSAFPAVAATNETVAENENVEQQNRASITFRNKSDYSLTIKIIRSYYGGLYTTVYLDSHSSSTVTFPETATYKLKIKAKKDFRTTYHDGGTFSVTCNDYEWTEGEMSFEMSSYGSGLGPSITAKEFESND